MIELVFVIVILGILASLSMERLDRDLRQEAATSVLSHIRLAKQLALNDNKHRSDNDARWQRAYWEWRYRVCANGDIFYMVRSDLNLNSAFAQNESAIDPATGKYLFLPVAGANGYCNNRSNKGNNNLNKVALTEEFGINNINRRGGCATGATRQYISFDYLGRPHHGRNGYASAGTAHFDNIMTQDCNLDFTLSTDQDGDGNDDTFTIRIEAETGHAFIVGQASS